MLNEDEEIRVRKKKSGGIRRNTGLCERSTEQEEEEKRTFVKSAVSVPLKHLFR